MFSFVHSATLVAAVAGAQFQPDGEAATVERFAAFIQEHSRDYRAGSDEYNERFGHFKEAVAAVDAHNQQADRSWNAAVNLLSDRTPAELAMLRGYRSAGKTSQAATSLGLMSKSIRRVDLSHLPKDFTWKGRLAAMAEVRDQGACGSCWAISSAQVLRAHAELYQQDRTFSTQQMVECTPNPQECGGQGGCKGATAELAMKYVTEAGLSTEEDHKYKAKDEACAPNMKVKEVVSFLQGRQRGGMAFGMKGFETLPENSVEPLLLALYEKGPVVVSVGANSKWSMYSNGVMNACAANDNVINHAVVLVGFGEQTYAANLRPKDLYWQIQNSWGSSWGESGFIRLKRAENHEENDYCGWDRKPEDGTGCKGGPSKVWVCGQCGILYDSVVPNFVQGPNGFLSRHIREIRGGAGIFTQINSTLA